MKFRMLRIPWSVVWGVLAVLLIVLWVRSCRQMEVVYRINKSAIGTSFGSTSGTVYFGIGAARSSVGSFDGGSRSVASTPADETKGWKYVVAKPIDLHPALQLEVTGTRIAIRSPIWLAEFLPFTLAVVPWLHWGFTTRTLLIATTLVAMVLGFAVWAARR